MTRAGSDAVYADSFPVIRIEGNVEFVFVAFTALELFQVFSYRVIIIVEWDGLFECREVVHVFPWKNFLCCCFFRAF
jgi:hypothetical protein